ncbi:hypothetical protein M885DRAFT_619654 [Pelagophyceae sp. CCMP2097]|nr:hypothetical protein M885DRAFT_619654 [Pelagophyceae sp. CCMP2097]
MRRGAPVVTWSDSGAGEAAGEAVFRVSLPGVLRRDVDVEATPRAVVVRYGGAFLKIKVPPLDETERCRAAWTPAGLEIRVFKLERGPWRADDVHVRHTSALSSRGGIGGEATAPLHDGAGDDAASHRDERPDDDDGDDCGRGADDDRAEDQGGQALDSDDEDEAAASSQHDRRAVDEAPACTHRDEGRGDSRRDNCSTEEGDGRGDTDDVSEKGGALDSDDDDAMDALRRHEPRAAGWWGWCVAQVAKCAGAVRCGLESVLVACGVAAVSRPLGRDAIDIVVDEAHEELMAFDDAVLCAVLCRVPLQDVGAVRSACRRLRRIASSAAFQMERTAARCAEAAVLVAGGVDGAGEACDAASCVLVGGGRARRLRLAPLPAARHSASTAVLDGSFVVLGGFLADKFSTASCVRLGVSRGVGSRWRRLPPMISARAAHACGIIDGILVVAGGIGRRGECLQGSEICDAEAYDPRAGAWARLEPMPFGVSYAASAVVGRTLVLAGGICDGAPCAFVQLYDGAARKWRLGAELPEASWGGVGAARGGFFFFVGGSRSGAHAPSRRVFSYDVSGDAWRPAAPLPPPVSSASVEGPRSLVCCYGDGIIYNVDGRAQGDRRGASAEDAKGDTEGWRVVVDGHDAAPSRLQRASAPEFRRQYAVGAVFM